MRPTTFNSTFPTFTAAILRALIDADVKNTPDGYAPTIDWDVFVDGNNWEISKWELPWCRDPETHAKVQASFDNFGKPRKLLFDLIREKGSWRIDDISSIRSGARWTMSKILTGAPDAFPDAAK
jgi:hypothetical protein